ncbi:MAG: DUF3267 domain-containing protein [Bacteroidota bacterium]|nr:DUF3267 domain-containing protein [Bacteroidota bacterium]
MNPVTKKDYSIPMNKVSTASLPFGVFAVLEFLIFVAIWEFEPIKAASDILLPWFFLPIFAVGIVLHELIHGLSWMFGGRLSFNQMKFGFHSKTLTPYAHCTVPIQKSAYVFGTLMPAVVLGFFPFLFSLINGNGWIVLFSILFTFAAVGDFLIVYLIRHVSWSALVEDHPVNAGCFVYESEKTDSSSKAESV